MGCHQTLPKTTKASIPVAQARYWQLSVPITTGNQRLQCEDRRERTQFSFFFMSVFFNSSFRIGSRRILDCVFLKSQVEEYIKHYCCIIIDIHFDA